MLELIRGPLLHAGGVDPTGWLWSDWNVEPTIAIGLLALVAGYLFVTRTSGETSPTLLPANPSSPPLLPTHGKQGEKPPLPAHSDRGRDGRVDAAESRKAPSPGSTGEGVGGEGERLRTRISPSPLHTSPCEPAHWAGYPRRGALWAGRLGVRASTSGEDAGEKANRTTTTSQKTSFIAGAAVLFVALGPPLDDWSDHYLLLAHMVQHLLLVVLAAPLLLYGTPAWVLEPLTRNRVTNAIGYWLTRPVIAYSVANAVFVLWHVPMFYEMALRSQPVHVFEHVSMLATALLAWWPTLGPLPQWPRLALPLHSLYYFAMTLPGTAVGAFITFADPGLYVPYDTAQRIFGIDLATDQQVAGLLMWVALGVIYLLLITVSFFRWVSREEAADREAESQAAAATAPPIPSDQSAPATG